MRQVMDHAKVARAADECLANAALAECPFTVIASFVQNLQGDSHWTDAEIIEVQNSVIRTLLKQIEDGAG